MVLWLKALRVIVLVMGRCFLFYFKCIREGIGNTWHLVCKYWRKMDHYIKNIRNKVVQGAFIILKAIFCTWSRFGLFLSTRGSLLNNYYCPVANGEKNTTKKLSDSKAKYLFFLNKTIFIAKEWRSNNKLSLFGNILLVKSCFFLCF